MSGAARGAQSYLGTVAATVTRRVPDEFELKALLLGGLRLRLTTDADTYEAHGPGASVPLEAWESRALAR